jgi:hypothetical protein
MNYSLILSLAAGATLATSSFAAPDLSKLPPPAKKENLTYAKDIKTIFEASCLRCHGDQKPKAELRLNSLEGVLKGGKDGQVIVPGKSAESPLVLAVARVDEKTAMPPKPRGPRPGGGPGAPGGSGNPPPANGQAPAAGGPPKGGPMGPMPKPLTTEQVSLIRAWVDQGAK